MKVDEIYVLYKNSDKFFKTYSQAYFNSKQPFAKKQIFYVFTPTMQECLKVSELESIAKNYFLQTADCDFFDIVNKFSSKQLKLGEL